MSGDAKRDNAGKNRIGLIPPYSVQEIAKVFTYGAEKYSPNNYRKGMNWSKCIDSLERHLNAFKQGIDFDEETKLLHMAHIATNAMFLIEYYKIYPQGDDRLHTADKKPKIGLDIDEILADWVKHWCDYYKKDIPEFWNFDRDIKQKFIDLKDNKDFWMSVPAKIKPSDIPFEPHCYITARGIPDEWTMEWLDMHGFAAVPLYTVKPQESKLEVAKASGIDIFVDDRWETFEELNKGGICCFLFDAPHNRRYNVGYKRLFSLKDLMI